MSIDALDEAKLESLHASRCNLITIIQMQHYELVESCYDKFRIDRTFVLLAQSTTIKQYILVPFAPQIGYCYTVVIVSACPDQMALNPANALYPLLQISIYHTSVSANTLVVSKNGH